MSTPRPYDPFARDCPSRRLLDRAKKLLERNWKQ